MSVSGSVTENTTEHPAGRAAARPEVTVAPLGRAAQDDFFALDEWAFALDPAQLLAEDRDLIAETLEWDRTYGASIPGPDGRLRHAGGYAVFSGETVLPGGPNVPCSGLTWVGVHPRDRRRGVLSAMIRHHLADVAARGEFLSLLWAAETGIYGRFGYGTATRALALTLPRSPGWRLEVPGAADLVVDITTTELADSVARLAPCYDAARRTRPGWLARTRDGAWADLLFDPRRRRNGREPLRTLTVAGPDGEVRGYAVFSRRPGWENHAANYTVQVRETVALDAAASAALWGRLTDLDLTTRIDGPLLPVDDPLLHLLADPRSADPRIVDGIWARLVDVPAALAARRYLTDVDVVLEVTDRLLPDNAGRWHLTGGPDAASCVRTEAPAHLRLDVRELGAAYLGGVTLTELAGAGLVRAEDPGVLAAVCPAFRSLSAPYCAWQF
jgi:predicted acetyltransferase